MKFKIGVRTNKICKMVLSSKIGIFGRFERGPYEEDRHFSQLCVKEFLELSCKLITIELFP